MGNDSACWNRLGIRSFSRRDIFGAVERPGVPSDVSKILAGSAGRDQHVDGCRTYAGVGGCCSYMCWDEEEGGVFSDDV